ncbi:MAG: archaeal proteasome endopeptidase complex subunit beta [Candidatus Micrarchaeia archaeon]
MDNSQIKRYEKILKGTTTVGIICSDGVVIGADSRATMGTFIASKETKKVFKIDENLGMTVAGGVGDAQELIRILKVNNEIYKMNEGRPMSPNAATSFLSIVLQENKMFPFLVQLIVGGLNIENKPMLYSIDPEGGYTEETKFTATGSGTELAIGYLEDIYKENISTKEALKVAAKAISIAASRDSAVGDALTLAAITKNGYSELRQPLEKVGGK